MNIVVKKTNNYKTALEVAQASKEYFQTGLNQLNKDIEIHLFIRRIST